MRISATFGQFLLAYEPPTHRPRPKPPHSLLANIPAIEAALASLLKLNKQQAIARSIMPEADMAAQQFVQEHGALAALIADPVNEAIHFAASILMNHLQSVVPKDQQSASAARLSALSGPEKRYAADTRVRH